MKLISLFLSAIIFFSCSKDDKYLHHQVIPKLKTFGETYNISEIEKGGEVDILWVIDNSGSMYDIQKSVTANANLFMNEFLKNNVTNWKMGMISMDENQQPFLGFSSDFTWENPDPVDVFIKSVDKLGTGGGGTEKAFYPIIKNLTQFPSFIRPASKYFITIIVTDAPEQSAGNWGGNPIYLPLSFYDNLQNLVGKNRILKFYGAFRAPDMLNCPSWPTDDQYEYGSSAYKVVIDKSAGFGISACSPDFGKDLAGISKEIVRLVSNPRIFLAERPIIDSIKVYYEGVELKGGVRGDGNIWFYNYDLNAVVFYNLEFAGDEIEDKMIDIDFDIDDGYSRDK